jgi:Fe-S-cluster containining protein
MSVFVGIALPEATSAANLRQAAPMASGLRHLSFRCTSCANCCKDLRVPLTTADLQRVVAQSALPVAEIVEWLPAAEVDLTGEPGSLVLLDHGSQRALMALAQSAGACRFLGPDGLCGVYEARPGSCRLYPFDAAYGRRGGLRRLRLLGGTSCEFARDGHTDVHALRHADEQRWREQRAYQAQVATWNRAQQHRLRFGRRALGGSEFLRFLGFG